MVIGKYLAKLKIGRSLKVGTKQKLKMTEADDSEVFATLV